MIGDEQGRSSAAHFRALAERYASVIAGQVAGPALAPHDFVQQVRAVIGDLYAAALHLPDIEPSTEEASTDVVDTDRWSAIYESLPAHLPHDAFWYIFEPAVRDPAVQPQAVVASLSDALADIYLDLCTGADLYDRGSLDDAVWDWKFHFDVHWGRHALLALTAFHAIATELDENTD